MKSEREVKLKVLANCNVIFLSILMAILCIKINKLYIFADICNQRMTINKCLRYDKECN